MMCRHCDPPADPLETLAMFNMFSGDGPNCSSTLDSVIRSKFAFSSRVALSFVDRTFMLSCDGLTFINTVNGSVDGASETDDCEEDPEELEEEEDDESDDDWYEDEELEEDESEALSDSEPDDADASSIAMSESMLLTSTMMVR